MKIKSGVWHWLAAGCGLTGLLVGMGIEGGAQLGGDIGKHSGKIKGICFHQRPPFAPGSFDSMYAAGVSNHGKACLEHQ